MREVGSYEAKTHFPALLRAVEAGETVIITRNGTPVARLVPETRATDKEDLQAVMRRMWEARQKRPRVTVEEILSARDEGRE